MQTPGKQHGAVFQALCFLSLLAAVQVGFLTCAGEILDLQDVNLKVC